MWDQRGTRKHVWRSLLRRGLALAALATLLLTGSAVGIITARGDASTQASTRTVRIRVVAREFKFALSRRSVPPGTTVIFKVVNKGKISHDFKIAGKRTRLLKPGKSATLRVKFSRKGRYRYLCTVRGHAKLGMKGSFTVGASVVRINVIAKEFSFALSRRSVPTGTTVVFKVVNRGKISHDFKIAGKKTRILDPGKSATLKVKFSRKGRYGYLCTVLGHAKLGMKGSFAVGVTASKTTTSLTTTTQTTTTHTTTTTTTECTTPTTTVNVSMIEYKFNLDKNSVPAGCIRFVIKNDGQVQHNFDLVGIKSGTILGPGGTETWSVMLSSGSKTYTCDVPFHESFGMTGALTVT